MPLVVRPARPDDNEALLALERSTPYVTRPFGTRFVVRTDRSPDYFALAETAGEALHVVAERAGRIVGAFCGVGGRGAGWGPERLPTSLCLDLRVEAAERSRPTAHRLTRALFRAEAERGTRVVVGLVLGRAREIRGMLDDRPAGIRARDVGTYVSYALAPIRLGPAPAGPEAEPARPADLPEIAALLAARHRGWPLAPDFAGDALGVPPGAFYVARSRAGAVLAAGALHDLTPLRRLVVEAFGPVLGAAVAAARPALALAGLELPRRGEPIRSISLRHLVHVGGAEGLRAGAAVVEAAARAARARRAHVLTLGLPALDARADLLRPYPRDPTPFVLYAGALDADGSLAPVDRPTPEPIYVDLALV